MNRDLLKEYVRSVINEDYDYGAGGYGDAGIDYTGGDHSQLYNVFVRPFVDVFKTAAGETKQLSQRVQTVGKVLFQSLVSTFIPIFGSEFDEIFQEEREQLEKIKGEYQDVYDRTWAAVKDNDILSAAFMYDPAGLITSTIIKKSPVQVLNLANVLSGGALDQVVEKVKKFKPKEAKNKVTAFLEKLFSVGAQVTGAGAQTHESIIREDKEQLDIVSKINSNAKTSRMRHNARNVVRAGLERQFDLMNDVMKATSIEQLSRLTKKPIKGLNDLKKVEEPERAQVEQKILQATKSSVKSLFVKKLEKQIKTMIDSGVPKDNAMVQDHIQALQRIKNA